MAILREEIKKYKSEFEKANDTMRPIKDVQLIEDLKELEHEVETAWDTMYGIKDIKNKNCK